MNKLRKDIITLIVFLASLILFSISFKSYWYEIKFSNNEIYYFKYSNIEIKNYISSNNSSSSNKNYSKTDKDYPIKEISYGKASDTQGVLLVCLTCTIISISCNLLIIIIQLINTRITSKHNSFLMAIISKVVSFIMISFNLSSILYLLSFRDNFDKECHLLGNCLTNINNGSSSSTSESNKNSNKHVNSIEFYGSTNTTYYRPYLAWYLNIATIALTILGICILFIKKDKEKKQQEKRQFQHKYQLIA